MKGRYYTDEQVPLILSVNDVADILGLSRAYAYNLFHTAGFPAIRIGKRMMVRKEKFYEWLLAQEQEVHHE